MEANVLTRWGPRAALTVALLGLAAHAAHTGLGLGRPELDDLFDQWLYNVLMVGAALACLLRGVVVREDRVAWLVLGAGALAWSAGDLWFSLVLADDAEPPLPSVSDALFLSFYPAAYAGLVLLLRRNVRDFHASLGLDALLGALAVSAVATAFLYDAVSVGIGGDTATVVTTLAYPVGDVLLLAFVTALLALTGWRPGATWALIGAALALGAVGDAAFLIKLSEGTYVEGTILDSVWPASMLLLAIAAWRRTAFRPPRLDGGRILAMPAFFACVAMALFVVDQVVPLNPVALGLACATIGVLILRLAVTLRENLRMVAASRGEALTDVLTGLGNRRKLVADLETELRVARTDAPRILVLFDLDGFKHYNDSLGHLAGDALLTRLGRRLTTVVRPYGEAYRMGGDEFCVVATVVPQRLERFLAQAAGALRESGDGFEVEASYGAVVIPHEAGSVAQALHVADQRMYARKESGAALRRYPVLARVDPTIVEELLAGLQDRGVDVEQPATDDREAYEARVAAQLRDVLDQEGTRV
jgi:diguanylate cyclase (GGDEF)-like protein